MIWDVIGDILPTALAVTLSPIPIIAVVLILGGPRASSTGPVFALGWLAGLLSLSALILLLFGASADLDGVEEAAVGWGKVVLGGLFLYMAVKQWRARPIAGEAPEMPDWMSSVESAGPGRALTLGILLSGLNPKNMALTASAIASVATVLADRGDRVVATSVFILVASLSVIGAVLLYLVSPSRARGPLDSVREFMTAYNAPIMTIILILIGGKLLGEGLDVLG